MPCVIWLNHFRNGREEWTEHTQCVDTPLIYKAQWYALFGGDFNYFFSNSVYLPLWCFWWRGTKFMTQAQSYFLFIFSISITLPLVIFSDKTSWETVRNKLFCSDFTCLMGGGTVCVLQKTSLASFSLSYLLTVRVTGVCSGLTHSLHVSQVKRHLSIIIRCWDGQYGFLTLSNPPITVFLSVSCSEPGHHITEDSSCMSCSAVSGG